MYSVSEESEGGLYILRPRPPPPRTPPPPPPRPHHRSSRACGRPCPCARPSASRRTLPREQRARHGVGGAGNSGALCRTQLGVWRRRLLAGPSACPTARRRRASLRRPAPAKDTRRRRRRKRDGRTKGTKEQQRKAGKGSKCGAGNGTRYGQPAPLGDHGVRGEKCDNAHWLTRPSGCTSLVLKLCAGVMNQY